MSRNCPQWGVCCSPGLKLRRTESALCSLHDAARGADRVILRSTGPLADANGRLRPKRELATASELARTPRSLGRLFPRLGNGTGKPFGAPAWNFPRPGLRYFRPGGLGRATATISATFFPHCEQAHPARERRERHRPPGDARERFGLDVPGRPAGAGDAHQEVTEALVEPLDVRQHAHRRMVGTDGGRVHAVPELCSPCTRY